MRRWLARAVQVQEERYAHKVAAQGDFHDERAIYAGRGTVGNLCIAPELKKHVAEIMRERNAIAKERRKAREERGLQKPPKKS